MIGHLCSAITSRLRALLSSATGKRSGRRDGKEVIQGSAGNVIIVKSPNTEYFKEAIFILCDDLFTRRGVDRKQLMREAREAAFSYVSDCVPPKSSGFLRFLVPFLLGVSSCFALLTLLRLL